MNDFVGMRAEEAYHHERPDGARVISDAEREASAQAATQRRNAKNFLASASDESKVVALPSNDNPPPAAITKQVLLDLTKAAVGDRGLNYGRPEDNFERIARRWRAHIKNRFGIEVALDATSVALMCADLKIARLENTPGHQDSWVDLAGYAACGAEIALAVQS